MARAITWGMCGRQAWANSLHALKLHRVADLWPSAIVFVFAILGLYEIKGKDPVMDQLWWAVALIVGTAAAFAVLFVINLFRAPLQLANALVEQSREERESLRAENEALRVQAKRPLDLNIGLGRGYKEPAALHNPHLKDGVVIRFPNTRITNRSATNRVNLGFTLEVPISNSPSGHKQAAIPLAEMQFLLEDRPSLTFLRDPLSVEPQDTITGDLAFIILPYHTQLFGENTMGFQMATVVVTDYVSDQVLRLNTASEHSWGPS
jgi:hypothetical protein